MASKAPALPALPSMPDLDVGEDEDVEMADDHQDENHLLSILQKLKTAKRTLDSSRQKWALIVVLCWPTSFNSKIRIDLQKESQTAVGAIFRAIQHRRGRCDQQTQQKMGHQNQHGKKGLYNY